MKNLRTQREGERVKVKAKTLSNLKNKRIYYIFVNYFENYYEDTFKLYYLLIDAY